MMAFNMEWLRLCRDKLKDNGTIWISGTYHNIFSVANCLTELRYGWFYKLALLDFELIFEVKMQESEGV